MFTVVTTTSGKSYNHDIAMLLCKNRNKQKEKSKKKFILKQIQTSIFFFNFGKKRVLQSSFVTCDKLYIKPLYNLE